jgi:ribosomal protein L16 Arg81 hydroxylase
MAMKKRYKDLNAVAIANTNHARQFSGDKTFGHSYKCIIIANNFGRSLVWWMRTVLLLGSICFGALVEASFVTVVHPPPQVVGARRCRRGPSSFPVWPMGHSPRYALSAALTNDENTNRKRETSLHVEEKDEILRMSHGPWNATLFGRSNCWGRHPLLMRNAFSEDDLSPLPTWDDIVELACQKDDIDEDDDDYEDDDVVTSRLIQHVPGTLDTYQASFGPFPALELQQSLSIDHKEHDPASVESTLVVNDVDRWIPEVSHWMDQYFGKYLPRWRRDDAQVSLAPRGGGIGPHVDNYDVFLIQVSGSRSWQVGPLNLSLSDEVRQLVASSEVSILNLTDDKSSSQEILASSWKHQTMELHMGDCLYVPPRAVHCGISTSDDCVTLSVGCRSPSASELLARVAEKVATSTKLDSAAARYKDVDHSWSPLFATTSTTTMYDENSPPLSNCDAAGVMGYSIKQEMKRLLRQAVDDILEDDVLWDDMVGQLITEPKRSAAGGGYPIPLRQMSDEWRRDLGIWANADATLDTILKGQGCLFRSEGVSFAASFPMVTYGASPPEKDAGSVVVHRLFAQGRTFELFRDATLDDSATASTTALLCRIANGPPLNLEALCEMKLIPLPAGTRKFLQELISEGFVYGWSEENN